MNDETQNPALLEACACVGLTVDEIEYTTEHTTCHHCVFKAYHCSGLPCSETTHKSKRAGVWVVKALTLEQAEAKIAELQKYVEALKAKAPVEGELYKHKRNGDIYIVVQDSANYQRLFLHCLKSKNSPTTIGCQYWSKDSIFGDSRDDFTPIGHVQDLL